MLGWPCLQLGGGVVLATDRLASITKVLLDDGKGQPCNTVSHLSQRPKCRSRSCTFYQKIFFL
jgi:hypothetical protein